MSDIPDSNLESDSFVTIDDHIILGGEDLREVIGSVAGSYIENIDERGRPLFDQFASRLLEASLYEGDEQPEVKDTAYRTFAFAKLIGFLALQPDHVGISMDGTTDPDTDYEANAAVLQSLISASMNEMRDSPGYLGLINEHRSKLDPTGEYPEIVDLFAGFSLFMMQNSLYHAADMERMQAAGDAMSEASEDDWKRGMDSLFE